MCTVSWHYSNAGYELFFNRDELLTRKRALAPAIKEQQQVRFIAPTDPDAGGTWISTNHFGITLCLLNNYGAQARCIGNNWVSRGHLVLELAHLIDVKTIQKHIKKLTLASYRPFDLLVLSLERHLCLLSWDGLQLRITDNPIMPLTSSSFDTERAIENRLQHFTASTTDCPAPDELANYHRSHQPERGAFSVCMHRENGQTVSFSRICVTPERSRFHYYDGPVCMTSQGEITELDIQPRKQANVA